MSGWDDPETVAYYEAFCAGHSRYVQANRSLIAHARLESGMRVLDLAAGTGRTTEAALPSLGPDGRVVSVEPFAAMRKEGIRRIADDRVAWRATLPHANESFDRVLCGAAIWQLEPIAETLRSLARLLRIGGALCFNIPALYLQEPDQPGGGADPMLLELPARLIASSDRHPLAQPPADQAATPLRRGSIRSWLSAAGLRGQSWSFRVRLTQEAYGAWLKIPVLTEMMLAGLPPMERARRIDLALQSVDRASWKWERWRGWTAWKHERCA